VIQGEIEGIVGGVVGMDVAGQEQPAGLDRGGQRLDLGQDGAMIFAVAPLHQAVVVACVVAVAGGGVAANPLDRRQGIDRALSGPEGGFQGVPSGRIAQAFEVQGEAVIAELDRADSLADGGLEGVLEALDPLRVMGRAVIGPGEDVGDSDGDEPSVGEALIEGIGGGCIGR
jgi:hypothetical protein